MVEPEPEHSIGLYVSILLGLRQRDWFRGIGSSTIHADELQAEQDVPISWRPRRHDDTFSVREPDSQVQLHSGQQVRYPGKGDLSSCLHTGRSTGVLFKGSQWEVSCFHREVSFLCQPHLQLTGEGLLMLRKTACLILFSNWKACFSQKPSYQRHLK